MGSASDALEDLTGVKVKAAPMASPAYNNVAPTDTNPAASALRDLLGDKVVAPTPTTFAERFQPATDQPLQKHEKGFEWSKVGDDAWSEVKKEAAAGVNDIAALKGRGGMGPVEGLATTGKAVMAPLRIAASPLAAVTSVGGHVMANLEHEAGKVIAPDIAAKDDPAKMYETAKGDVGTALSAARMKNPAAATEAANAKIAATPRTISDLKEMASRGYEHPDLVGLEVKPEALQHFALRSELELSKKGLNDTSAPKVVKVLREAQDVPGNATVTGQNIVSLRRSLGEIAGDGGSEAKAAKTAIDHLDEWLPKINPDHVVNGDPAAAFGKLEQANADYSAAAHADLVDKKLLRAELRSASAHSGMGVTNQVRGRMADILINKKEQRGFAPEELDQMRKIVYGTTTQNIVRGAGNMLGGGGGVGSSILGIMTMGLTPGIGMGLRAIGNRMTLNQAQKLSEMIRSRPGLSSSLQKFEESAVAAQQNRDPRTMAGLVMASRNLASNLKDAGVNISHSDILRGLQSQVSAEDQKDVPRPPGQ